VTLELPQSALWLLARCTLHRAAPQASLQRDPVRWRAPALMPGHLAHYRKQLGFEAAALPLCYHYLALQRAQLDWMLRPAFPYRLLGMVHLAQTLVRTADWDLGAGFDIELQAEPEGKRNLLLRAELRQAGQVKLRSSSLYRPPTEEARRPLRARSPEPTPPGEPLAQWDLPASAGRSYARLSGDANPIHLWPATARWLGLADPIIHGMHTMARCEAELTHAMGCAPQALSMQFLRPVTLPGWAQLRQAATGYEVWGPAGRSASLQLTAT